MHDVRLPRLTAGPVFNASLGVWIGGDFWDGRVPDLSTQAQQLRRARTQRINAIGTS